MAKKIINFLEGTAAGAALFSVMAVTVITVIAINPKVDRSSMVAGIQTQQRGLEVPLLINDIESQKEIVASNSGGSYNYKFSKTISAPDANLYKYSFISIKNLNNVDVIISMNAAPETQVLDGVRIWVSDETDKILLYSPGQDNLEKNITIRKLSTRKLSVEYEILDKINYPLTTVFSIKQK